MLIREVLESEKETFNKIVNHPLQSWEWGQFRQKTGVKVIRLASYDNDHMMKGYQLTIHSLPHLPYTIGYFPRGPLPDQPLIDSLIKIAKEENLLFIKIEPNISPHPQTESFLLANGCRKGKPLFPKYSFQIDLNLEEEELFSKMKEKTRYNVRLAQKSGVVVEEDNSPAAFSRYLELTGATTRRQGFFAHNRYYHELMWQTLQPAGIAHLMTATYQNKILVTWVLFLFNGVLYYPYGASSDENREVMASNLMMWEAMRWGKTHNARLFDLWGALGPNANPKDPWYGFHHFKEGYGGNLVEFIGTYDLVINPPFYSLYNLADNLRWKLIDLKTNFPIRFS
ncbi:MAG: peptidoglycan bridge formation glycyltransferase FemA/FemB family protein [Candidatus Gottesmanbacteria bacterium]